MTGFQSECCIIKECIFKSNPSILPCITTKRTEKITDAHWKSGCNGVLKHSDTGVINYEQVLLLAFVNNTLIKGIKCQNIWYAFQ